MEKLLSTIKDWDLLHQRHFCVVLQDYCALQELLMKMNFTIAVAPPLCIQLRHFRPRPLTLFGNMASLVNLLGGDKWQNMAT